MLYNLYLHNIILNKYNITNYDKSLKTNKCLLSILYISGSQPGEFTPSGNLYTELGGI